jgi:hypothetical protein
MAERQITEADVGAALGRQFGEPQSGQPGTIVLQGHAAGGRVLKVCVRASDHEFVVTAWWT